jgi:hypothetical protein
MADPADIALEALNNANNLMPAILEAIQSIEGSSELPVVWLRTEAVLALTEKVARIVEQGIEATAVAQRGGAA